MSSRLGELLAKRGDLTAEQLAKALEQQREHGGALASHLVKLGFINEDALLSYLAEGVPPPGRRPVEPRHPARGARPRAADAGAEAPPDPGQPGRARRSRIAMADPSNLVAINEVKFLTGYDVKIAVAGATRHPARDRPLLRRRRQLRRGAERAGRRTATSSSSQGEEEVDLQELERATEDAPVVRLVNALLTDAIKKRASDIHVEPYEKMLRVRFRIDGVLYEIMQPPLKLKNAITSRIKVMASLDIAERRLPQDGRIKLKLGGNQRDGLPRLGACRRSSARRSCSASSTSRTSSST